MAMNTRASPASARCAALQNWVASPFAFSVLLPVWYLPLLGALSFCHPVCGSQTFPLPYAVPVCSAQGGGDHSADPDGAMGGRGRSERHRGFPVHEGRRLHHVAGHLHRRWFHGQRVDDLTGEQGRFVVSFDSCAVPRCFVKKSLRTS